MSKWGWLRGLAIGAAVAAISGESSWLEQASAVVALCIAFAATDMKAEAQRAA